MVRGSIRILPRGSALRVDWQISDFFSLPEQMEYCADSPSFWFSDAEWCLRLYPYRKYEEYTDGYTEIQLVKVHSETIKHEVDFCLGIRDCHGCAETSQWNEAYFKRDKAYCGTYELIKKSDLRFKKLSRDGVMIFFCYLQVTRRRTSDASTQARLPDVDEECSTDKEKCWNNDNRMGVFKLAKNLNDLLLSEEGCDVTLKVKNREFKAHRAILVARSSVFSSMFRQEISEKLDLQVEIIDCDPDAFQLFLAYLYTGGIESLSDTNVFDAYTVANKYDVAELKVMCTKYIMNILSLESICDIIEFSLLHNEPDLLNIATKFFTKHFKEIIVTFKWQCFMRDNSTASNEMLIKALQYYNLNEEGKLL